MTYQRHSLVRIAAALCVAIGPVGCTADATSPVIDAHVQAVAVRVDGEAPRVVVINRSDRPIFTTVLGRNAAALMQWVACVDAAACPPIAPAATRLEIPATIDGTLETEAIVYWWHAVRGADGVMRPDSIRSFIVRL